MKHKNPYYINDHEDLLEVTANSSHGELKDCKRLWKFGGYTFDSPTKVEEFFNQEGLDIRKYDWDPEYVKNWHAGSSLIVIHIKEKWKTKNHRALQGLKQNVG